MPKENEDKSSDYVAVSATEVKSHLGEYLDMASNTTVFIEKHGKPKNVILSYKRFMELIAVEERLHELEIDTSSD
jgi:prevent-host-death family protein